MEKTSFSYRGQELGSLAKAANYYRWIFNYFRDHLGKRVIEVGPGHGAFSELLLNDTKTEELILVEPAANLFPLLQRRFSGEKKVRLIHDYLEGLSDFALVDTLIAINVFGLIEEDEAFLKSACEKLKPGGRLLLFAPALPFLCGTLDAAFGMVHRYTKSELVSKIQTAGFRIKEIRYFNFLGVLGWFVAAKVLKRKTLNLADVQFYDQWIVPWLSRIERVWEPPIGQSLVVVARKD